MKLGLFIKFKNMALYTSVLWFSQIAYGFEYFDRKMDYWTKQDDPTKDQQETEAKSQPDFSWKKALDPMDDSLEFFKEGDHVPPRPYIEMFRNPNDENIKNWFTLMKKKNELATRLQKKMRDYLNRNQIPQPIVADYNNTTNALSPPETPVDATRYRLRLYFHSECPHCKRMLATAKDLAKRGFYLEMRQIDDDPQIRGSVPFPVQKATKEELEKKQISSWPVLLIADLKTKLIYRINGYQNAESVINTLRSKK